MSESKMSVTKSKRRKILFAAVSLMISLAIVEVILRVVVPLSALLDNTTDDYFRALFMERAPLARERGSALHDLESDSTLGWRMKPSLRLPKQTTNSKGLRGTREYTYERVPNVKRIVVLGDSFTFGVGVLDHETYPALMEKQLESTEVLNFGVNGYGTDQQLLYWLEEGVKYRPDIVILGYYTPDFIRNGNYFRMLPKPRFEIRGDQMQLVGPPLASEKELLEKGLTGAPSGLRLFFATRYLFRRVGSYLRKHREPDETFDEKAEISDRILRRLHQSCEDVGARLFIVTIPHFHPTTPDEDRRREVIEKTCSEVGIPRLHLDRELDVPPSEREKDPIYLPNAHWSPFGHSLATKQILTFLREQGALE